MSRRWDAVQHIIHDLYIIQRRTLREVRNILHKTYHFTASTRSYRGKLKDWGYIRRQDILRHTVPMNLSVAPGPARNPALVAGSIDEYPHLLLPLPLSSVTGAENSWTTPILESGVAAVQTGGQQHDPRRPLQSRGTQVEDFITYLYGQTAVAASVSNPKDVLDEDGYTALHRAVKSRSFQDVQNELAMGANPDVADRDGDTALHHASRDGHTDIIRLLLKRRADVMAKNKLLQTPLHLAIKSKKATRTILAAYPAVSSPDVNGNSPLHLALMDGDYGATLKNSTIEQMVLARADLNVRNEEQKSSFELLISPDISLPYSQRSVLVKLFLEHGADIFQTTSSGTSPFELYLSTIGSAWSTYCLKNSLYQWNDSLKMFITKGANVDVEISPGQPLIHEAIEKCLSFGRDKELPLLLCKRSSLHMTNSKGDFPLHHLIRCRGYEQQSFACLEALVSRESDLNHKNKSGETALVILLQSRYWVEERLKWLLDAGAEPMFLSNDLPIYVAARNESTLIPKKVIITTLLNLILDKASGSDTWVDRVLDLMQVRPDFMWWKNLFSYIRTKDLDMIADLTNLTGLPSDVAKYVGQFALSHATSRVLQNLQTEFEEMRGAYGLEYEGTQRVIAQLVRTIRESAKYEIEVNPKWYQYLLNFFTD